MMKVHKHIDKHHVHNVSNKTSPFYSRTLLSQTPSPLPIQVFNASAFSEMIKSIFAVQGANVDCQEVSTYVLENTYDAKRGGRQFSMFMSENICTLVDLLDKAAAEGVSNHCGNEVGR